MNYDPYFEAEICVKCGKMERKRSTEIQKVMVQQTRNVEIARQILSVMTAR
jgi:Zn ribbon nucleic-acid-binding protein